MVHKLVLWESTNGCARRDRKTITYVDKLKEDSGKYKWDEVDDVGQRCLER